jgi:hypothetical protein
MCDDYDKILVLLKGTILYSGNITNKTELTIKDIFRYMGQRKKDYQGKTFILYASRNYNVAWGYASSCLTTGYVHKFRLTRDITLLQGDDFEDAEEVEKCICDKGHDGYSVIYSETQDEFAFCNSENYLEYISSIKCLGKQQFQDVELTNVVTALDLYDLELADDK